MKKNIFGRKLKSDKNERKALFKNLLSELVMHGRIKTTEQKAKSIKAAAEKLIKKAQKEAHIARNLLSIELIPQAIEKMISDIAPQFTGRNGGYTRIIKLGRRFNDDASMVLMEWVESVGVVKRDKSQGEKVKKEPIKKKTTNTDIVEGEIVTEKAKPKAKKETKSKKGVSKKGE